MSRLRYLASDYWFDALIALLATTAMLELIVGRDSPNSARTLWFALPAIGILVLPIFLRRRLPFAALTMYWLLAMAISIVDWRRSRSRSASFPSG